MTVVYLDSVFLLNGLMDYLLLMASGRLAGTSLRRSRCLWAALLGGLYAAAVFLPGYAFLASPAVKLSVGTLLALLAFGGEEKFFRMALLFFAVSCGMAGTVLVLGLLAGGGFPVAQGVFYTDVSPKILMIAATAAYLVLTVVFRASARHGVQGELLPVQICIQNRTQHLTALWDSGNSLRDPMGNRPVLVTAPGSLEALLPPALQGLMTPVQLRRPTDLLEIVERTVPALHPCLLPYRAVGTAGGLLLAVETDWTEIAGTRYPHLLVGLSPTALGDGYTALWGGSVEQEKGGWHHARDLWNPTAAAADPARTAAGFGNSLHRRK